MPDDARPSKPTYEELERRVAELEAQIRKLQTAFEEAVRAGKH